MGVLVCPRRACGSCWACHWCSVQLVCLSSPGWATSARPDGMLPCRSRALESKCKLPPCRCRATGCLLRLPLLSMHISVSKTVALSEAGRYLLSHCLPLTPACVANALGRGGWFVSLIVGRNYVYPMPRPVMFLVLREHTNVACEE